MNNDQRNQIGEMLLAARTGDLLAVYTRTFMGFWIRRMLSKGLKRCHTNHNAPVFGYGPSMLQIEPPSAEVHPLASYLTDLYEDGGWAILLRPDAYRDGMSNQSEAYLINGWMQMRGVPYDKTSIRMFLRMIYRKGAKLVQNDDKKRFCTEGTLAPILANPFCKWEPDLLKNEQFAAPIHVEHLIRQERLLFVAGNKEKFFDIKYA